MHTRSSRAFRIVCLLFQLTAAQWLSAAALVVTNGNDDGPGSLRAAIVAATSGSAITFTFTGSIALLSGLTADKDLTITGPGASSLEITRSAGATGSFSLLTVNAGITAHVSNLTIAGGRTDEQGGGGITNNGNLSLAELTLANNTATRSASAGQAIAKGGGCVNAAGATLSLTNCRIENNLCDQVGGGVSSLGTLTVLNSTFSGNAAGYGGAIYSADSATITNCTIVGNHAGPTGADHLSGSGFGGGLDLFGNTSLSSVTISGNSCDFSGGGICCNGAVNLRNCIVAGNSSSAQPDMSDLSPGTISQGFNLIGIVPSNTTLMASDKSGTVTAPLDPMLGPLRDNGGFAPTQALLPGSPAIDQGIATGQPVDERGSPRTTDQPRIPNATGGDGTDIGAFELAVVPPTFGNISTRTSVGADDHVLIAGFIIRGSDPKRILLRGLGPSLPVSDKLANPALTLTDSTGTTLATNDDWKDNQQQDIIATTIPPTNDLESAITATLPPGSYTAKLEGIGGATGVGLVEVYDLDQAANSNFANVSTRGFVQTGENVMIGGIIIVGSEPVNVLLRALGPSLAMPTALADPTLELHDANGASVAANDNWKDVQETEIRATKIAPSNDAESAILKSLFPGEYTAVVRGKNDTSGVALVEAYWLND